MHGGPLPVPWIIMYRSDSIVSTARGTLCCQHRITMLIVTTCCPEHRPQRFPHLVSTTFLCEKYVSLNCLLQNKVLLSLLLLL